MNNNDQSYSIYGLIDPTTKELKYVGRSTNLDQRYKDHCGDKNEGTTAYRSWKSEMFGRGEKPELTIFTVCDSMKSAMWAERFFAFVYYIQGCELTNRMKTFKDGHLVERAVYHNDAQAAFDLAGISWDAEAGRVADRKLDYYKVQSLRNKYQLAN